MKLLGPIAHTDRSVPESTLSTWHPSWSCPPWFANTEECILVGSKRLASFDPRAFTSRSWCGLRHRCGSRCGFRSGPGCGFRGRLRRRLRGRLRGRLRCGLGGRLGSGWSRSRERYRCRWFRYRRGRLTSLLDFHKLIRKGLAYNDSYVFTFDHTVRN